MAIIKDSLINDTGFLTIPSGTTAQRPSPAVIGDFRYNTTENEFEIYNGTAWESAVAKPTIGSEAATPALTAKEAYDDGLRGNTIWIKIGNTAYQMDYDDGDRYGTGERGWANYTNTVFGNNNASIPNSTYGTPANIIPAWNTNSNTSTSNDTISTGQLRIGREQSHAGGNSLSTVRCAVPLHTSLYYQLTNAQAGGADTADFGTGWQTGNYGSNIYNNSAYQSNGQGYWCIMHSGNASDTSNSTNRRILDPGNLTSGNNSWTTNNYETWGSQLNPNYTPYIIWGTTDAYREYAYIRGWNVWLH